MREKKCGGRKTTGLSRTTHQPGATLTPPHRTGTSRQRPEGSRTQKPCHETEGLNPTAQQDRTRMQNSCMNRGLIPPNWGVELLVHHQERLCQFVAFVFNHKLDTHRPWICRTQQNLQALSLTPALSRWERGRRQAAFVCGEPFEQFERTTSFLPLPAGEGWGEGERVRPAADSRANTPETPLAPPTPPRRRPGLAQAANAQREAAHSNPATSRKD